MDRSIRALRSHLDLNYNFGYSPESTIDSARVGNETRYINHAKGNLANAFAGSTLLELLVPVYCC
jgi:SET domain-containing protein